MKTRMLFPILLFTVVGLIHGCRTAVHEGSCSPIKAKQEGKTTIIAPSDSSYLDTISEGRTFSSLTEAHKANLSAGDQVLIRNLDTIAPPHVFSAERTLGKWWLRPYALDDGQHGRLLMVNERIKDDTAAGAVPPEFEVKLDLPGWYAIWIGVPRMNLRPSLSFFPMDGVDVRLDPDPAYVPICAERGNRKGRLMGPMDVEIMCLWKCARLDGRSLHIRMPFGTYSVPMGAVRGNISSLRLVRLSDRQVADYRKDISNPTTKRVIVAHDGNTDIAHGGVPGKGLEARFVTAYADSDVKILIYQAVTTCVATWPSRLTTLLGDEMTDEMWKHRRKWDRKLADYIHWSVENKQEPIKVVSEYCRKFGMQCHAGLRMNLMFPTGEEGQYVGDFLNGGWWHKHPELRVPGGLKLDYSLPQARQFVIDLLMEMVTNYDVNGLSLDFTRWPPVADIERHDFSVLTNFIREIRQALDQVETKKGHKLALSAMVVEGHHTNLDLTEQKIDLEAWLASGTLDFICVQSWNEQKFITLAKRYNIPYYSIQDQESFKPDDPEWYQKRPDDEWGDFGLDDEPFVDNALDPTEYDRGFLEKYQMGADGVCLVNNMWGWRSTGRLGHIEEMKHRSRTGQVWGQQVGPKLSLIDQ